jgi:hypothetical protein
MLIAERSGTVEFTKKINDSGTWMGWGCQCVADGQSRHPISEIPLTLSARCSYNDTVTAAEFF